MITNVWLNINSIPFYCFWLYFIQIKYKVKMKYSLNSRKRFNIEDILSRKTSVGLQQFNVVLWFNRMYLTFSNYINAWDNCLKVRRLRFFFHFIWTIYTINVTRHTQRYCNLWGSRPPQIEEILHKVSHTFFPCI